MIRQPIAETTFAGLRLTGVGGTRILENWEQIDHFLRENLGPDIADLFTEPVFQGEGVIWFGPEGEPVIPFRDLPAGEQAALRSQLANSLNRLSAEVERLRSAPDPNARLIGEALQRAQQVPPPVEDCLFSVAGRPVLINWSLEPEGSPSPFQPLREFVHVDMTPPPPTVAPPPPVPEAVPAAIGQVQTSSPLAVIIERRSPWWWLLWLLAALLLAAIGYLLLHSCGLRLAGISLNYCSAMATTAETEREGELLAELSELQQRLDQAPRCDARPPAAPPVPTPAPAAPPPQQNEEFERRMRNEKAQEGELTITLIWNSPSDLDLYVTCPSGITIRTGNARPAGCDGYLDVDANIAAVVESPVENIFFPAGRVRPGTYRVEVKNFKSRIRGNDTFQVRVKKGEEIKIYNGELSNQEKYHVIDVTVP